MMFDQLSRLARHSAIYGLGKVVQAILVVLLLPLYTSYLSPEDYGAIEVLLAASLVLAVILRGGITNAFFRFYFDAPDTEYHAKVVRTAFWFTMASATTALVLGLALAESISDLLFGSSDQENLVRAAALGLWALMNFEQLTSVFRVEERSKQFVIATTANLLITVGATVLLVVVLEKGAVGVLVGSFTGTIVVYVVLLAHRRYQLGFEFDFSLLRQMMRFGLPLVPTALTIVVIGAIDRFFVLAISGAAETGVYSMAIRIASAVGLLLFAFQTAWPAFAYSIEDDDEARRTYGYVLTYLVYIMCWVSAALGLLSPWLVRILAPSNPSFWPASRAVGLLAFGLTAFAAFVVVSIGIGRVRRTQFNWVVTGTAAAFNIVLNLILIPPYGMMGAAVATAAAYVGLFLMMATYAQRTWRVPYQWRRVSVIVATSVGLTALGTVLEVPLSIAVTLAVAFPVVLVPLGFYLPDEWERLRRLSLNWRS